jgi:hypothetical protein
MKPTIGRIVHYYSETDQEPFAALVTAVLSGHLVTLTVFPPNTDMFTIDGASFSEAPTPRHWTWPPRV